MPNDLSTYITYSLDGVACVIHHRSKYAFITSMPDSCVRNLITASPKFNWSLHCYMQKTKRLRIILGGRLLARREGRPPFSMSRCDVDGLPVHMIFNLKRAESFRIDGSGRSLFKLPPVGPHRCSMFFCGSLPSLPWQGHQTMPPLHASRDHPCWLSSILGRATWFWLSPDTSNGHNLLQGGHHTPSGSATASTPKGSPTSRHTLPHPASLPPKAPLGVPKI
jgi:hypothetical protein